MSTFLSAHSHQGSDTAVTVASEVTGRTGHIHQPSCPIRCKGPTLRCAQGRESERSRAPSWLPLWPSEGPGLPLSLPAVDTGYIKECQLSPICSSFLLTLSLLLFPPPSLPPRLDYVRKISEEYLELMLADSRKYMRFD